MCDQSKGEKGLEKWRCGEVWGKLKERDYNSRDEVFRAEESAAKATRGIPPGKRNDQETGRLSRKREAIRGEGCDYNLESLGRGF
eukprot:755471-Hanusia_phi.AAC.2